MGKNNNFSTQDMLKDWDLYQSMVGSYHTREGSWRIRVYVPKGRTFSRINSLLVATREGEDSVVSQSVRGTIDEIFPIDLGKGEQVLYMSSHFRERGFITVVHSYYVISGRAFRQVWRIVEFYDPLIKETYDPPEFHYWDGDDDGIRELVLTNHVKGKIKWKLKWAVFRWDRQKALFVPVRGLLYSKYAEQAPGWVVFAVIEAAKYRRLDMLSLHIAARKGCNSVEGVGKLLSLQKWRSIGVPEVSFLQKDKARVRIRLQSEGAAFIAEALVTRISVMPPVWKICRIKLLKLENQG